MQALLYTEITYTRISGSLILSSFLQVRVDIQCQLETGFDHAGCSGLLRVKRYFHSEEGQSILVEMLARHFNQFQVGIR